MKKATYLNNFYSVYIRNLITYNKRCDDFLIWMYTEGNKQQEKIDMKKEFTNKQRKVWKLKRKNVVLGQQRASLLRFKVPSVSGFLDSDGKFVVTALDVGLSHKEYLKLISLSEQIGKNSNKIQRLRTLIQQEKLGGNLNANSSGQEK